MSDAIKSLFREYSNKSNFFTILKFAVLIMNRCKGRLNDIRVNGNVDFFSFEFLPADKIDVKNLLADYTQLFI